MVVSWKENLGRQLQLITPENERGDETNCPSPPHFTFFDDPDVPFGPCGPPAPPGPHERQVRLAYHQDGLLLHHQLVVEKRVGTGNTSRDRYCIRDLHHPSLNLFQIQQVMAKMISHR